MLYLLTLLALAPPFWETKPPQEWTPAEVNQLLSESPWAQLSSGTGRNPNDAPPVQIYIASAAPVRAAEKMARRFAKRVATDPLYEEYLAFLEEDQGKSIIVAIRYADRAQMEQSAEVRRMEESVLRAGKKKIRLSGHFPPSSSDPYLRLVFPKELDAGDKTVTFQLYLPGVPLPFRQIQFDISKMVYQGKPAL